MLNIIDIIDQRDRSYSANSPKRRNGIVMDENEINVIESLNAP
jgi:hypothetical protein